MIPNGSADLTSRQVGLIAIAVGLVFPAYTVGVAVASPTLAGSVTTGTGAETTVGVQGVDGTARVIEYGANGTEKWRQTGERAYFDVTRLDNGTVLAAFVNTSRSSDCERYSGCAFSGVQVIDPTPDPHVVWEYSFELRQKHNSEVHDVEYLGDGRVLIADMAQEQLFSLNMSTRERGWTWNASSFYEAPADPTTRDWLHINDVDQIEPGRYLVSVRNANQLLIIEQGNGVVEVINEDDGGPDELCSLKLGLVDADGDGDIRCGDASVIARQHNPQWLGNGTVMVSDSENDRIVELHRTEDGTWEVGWAAYRAGQIPFEWPRDADRQPDGTTLITDSLNHRVVLVDEDGTLLRTLPTATMPYEADIEGREPVGGPAVGSLDGDPVVTQPADGDIPLLTETLIPLQHMFRLPWWFGELHLGGLILSLFVLVFGFSSLIAGGQSPEQATAGDEDEGTTDEATGGDDGANRDEDGPSS